MPKTVISAYVSDNMTSKQYNYSSWTAFSIATLLLVQGMMAMPAQAANASKSGHRVLMIEMTPALCNLQPTRSRMRQCLEGYSLTVSGLDMGYGERCGRGSEPRLTPLQLPNELNTGNSYTVLKSRFIGQMTSLNSGMTPASVDLICQAGTQRQMILTDVHVCYEGNEFANCHNVVDNCGSKFVISGGK